MIQAGVIGVGQTKYDAKRRDVSMAGLVREAIDNAMLAANVEWDAIDAVVLGKAPDMFEGVIMPELYLADAIGAVGKPVLSSYCRECRRKHRRDSCYSCLFWSI